MLSPTMHGSSSSIMLDLSDDGKVDIRFVLILIPPAYPLVVGENPEQSVACRIIIAAADATTTLLRLVIGVVFLSERTGTMDERMLVFLSPRCDCEH